MGILCDKMVACSNVKDRFPLRQQGLHGPFSNKALVALHIFENGHGTMKVRLVGFYWKKADGVSFGELFGALEKLAHKEQDFAGYKRLLYTVKSGQFHVGVFLTSKDQKKAPTVNFVNQMAEVRVMDLGKPIVDFNFFVLHEETGCGIYQQYHHSAGLRQFTGFCKKYHDQIRDTKRDLALEQLGESTKKQKADARKPFQRTLTSGYLIQESELQAVLGKMKRIKEFNFEYAAVTANNSVFKPLTDKASKEVHRLVFAKSPVASLVSNIVNVINACGIKSGAVIAERQDGEDQRFDIFENPSHYGEFDFDKIATDDTLNVADIASSPFLRKMLLVAKRQPEITIASN